MNTAFRFHPAILHPGVARPWLRGGPTRLDSRGLHAVVASRQGEAGERLEDADEEALSARLESGEDLFILDGRWEGSELIVDRAVLVIADPTRRERAQQALARRDDRLRVRFKALALVGVAGGVNLAAAS